MEDGQGRTVFVTGGGRGIGAAIVRALAAQGFDVAFTYRRASSEAAALRKALEEKHPSQAFTDVEADLADKAQVAALAGRLEDWPRLWGFVHNAGTTADALTAMIDQGRAERLMQVNFWSMVRLVKAASRPMFRARGGRIIGVGSITAARGAQGNAAYAASKGAMASYMRTLALEAGRRGVTANVVAPGYVDTDMLAPYAGNREVVEKQIPIGRFAASEEVASLVCYLMSPAAACITGAQIPVDGGLSAAIAINNEA